MHMAPDAPILQYLLRQLHDGEPWQEEVIVAGLRLAFRHKALTRAEAMQIIQAAEDHGWITGLNDPLRGRLWSITAKGRLKFQEVS